MLKHYQSQHEDQSLQQACISGSSQKSLKRLQTVEAPSTKASYERKIYKIQKRSDQLRKSTMDNNTRLKEAPLLGNPSHARSVQQPTSQQKSIQSYHNKSTNSCQNSFEKKQTDRRKRTFNILRKFNPALASEVIYQEGQQKHQLGKLSSQLRHQVECAIVIQKNYRAFKARKLYNELLLSKLLEQEERHQKEHEQMIEQWMIQQETARLQQKIEERSRLFRYQLKKRQDSAIVIQRAFREFLRKKNKGISTTQILERKQMETMDLEEQMQTYAEHLKHQEIESQQDTKRSKTPRSVGASQRLGQAQLVNRTRQLQIQTTSQRLLNCHIQSSFGYNSTTPLGLSNILSMNNSKLQKSLNLNISNTDDKQDVDGLAPNLIPLEEGAKVNNNDIQKTGERTSGMFSFGSEALNSAPNDTISSPLNNYQKQAFNMAGQQHLTKNVLQLNLQNTQTQLNCSLNKLFEQLKPPLMHQHQFDLTQKINENFKDLLTNCEAIDELDSIATPIPSSHEELDQPKSKKYSKQKVKSSKSTKKNDQQKSSSNENSIYNKFLREESIKDELLMQEDFQTFYKPNPPQEESIDSEKQQIPFLYDPNGNANNSSGSLLGDDEGLNSSDWQTNLNENDFPMTQLIKERTIGCHEANWEIRSTKDQETTNSANQLELGERYKYFRALVKIFNAKEKRLREGLEKREELIKNINYYKQLCANVKQMMENSGQVSSQLTRQGVNFKKKVSKQGLQKVDSAKADLQGKQYHKKVLVNKVLKTKSKSKTRKTDQ